MQHDLTVRDYDKEITKDLGEDKLKFEVIELPGIVNPNGWEFLDLGCGSGIQVKFLAEQFSEVKQLIGVDNSPKLIELAKGNTNDDRCHYYVGDIHSLPFKDAQFDFIYSRYVIHYSTNMTKVLGEVNRVCKPGGRAYIQVVHPIYELFKKESKDYGSSEEAIFIPQTAPIEVKHATHTVSEYINAVIDAGMQLTNIEERYGGQSHIDTFRVPTILILRLTKNISEQ